MALLSFRRHYVRFSNTTIHTPGRQGKFTVTSACPTIRIENTAHSQQRRNVHCTQFCPNAVFDFHTTDEEHVRSSAFTRSWFTTPPPPTLPDSYSLLLSKPTALHYRSGEPTEYRKPRRPTLRTTTSQGHLHPRETTHICATDYAETDNNSMSHTKEASKASSFASRQNTGMTSNHTRF